jgi:hypothetical protein
MNLAHLKTHFRSGPVKTLAPLISRNLAARRGRGHGLIEAVVKPGEAGPGTTETPAVALRNRWRIWSGLALALVPGFVAFGQPSEAPQPPPAVVFDGPGRAMVVIADGTNAPNLSAIVAMASNTIIQSGVLESNGLSTVISNTLAALMTNSLGLVMTNDMVEPHPAAPPPNEGFRNDRSRDPNRDRSRDGGSSRGPGSSRASELATGTSYNSFGIITERNIFSQNRRPGRTFSTPTPTVRSRPRAVESFTLKGTLGSEKGWVAFMTGSSPQYTKALKVSDAFAGYKVTGITQKYVKLMHNTNEVVLRVDMSMRREDEGDWRLSREGGPFQFASTYTPGAGSDGGASTRSTTASDSPSSGADSDVIRRLMQKREQEMNR